LDDDTYPKKKKNLFRGIEKKMLGTVTEKSALTDFVWFLSNCEISLS